MPENLFYNNILKETNFHNLNISHPLTRTLLVNMKENYNTQGENLCGKADDNHC